MHALVVDFNPAQRKPQRQKEQRGHGCPAARSGGDAASQTFPAFSLDGRGEPAIDRFRPIDPRTEKGQQGRNERDGDKDRKQDDDNARHADGTDQIQRREEESNQGDGNHDAAQHDGSAGGSDAPHGGFPRRLSLVHFLAKPGHHQEAVVDTRRQSQHDGHRLSQRVHGVCPGQESDRAQCQDDGNPTDERRNQGGEQGAKCRHQQNACDGKRRLLRPSHIAFGNLGQINGHGGKSGNIDLEGGIPFLQCFADRLHRLLGLLQTGNVHAQQNGGVFLTRRSETFEAEVAVGDDPVHSRHATDFLQQRVQSRFKFRCSHGVFFGMQGQHQLLFARIRHIAGNQALYLKGLGMGWRSQLAGEPLSHVPCKR
ncbi:hypothetical protein B4135_3211 [Caldibacillus debilis]|uniref:Uncharacterized protein n=1 Tax=Caldibacillus debilis TaxID=301148 RepID=A0A150LGR7_9BACI|nr:hypothetical protein B4135_3211 [Caldibacillus debilis]